MKFNPLVSSMLLVVFLLIFSSVIWAENKVRHEPLYYFSFDESRVINQGSVKIPAIKIPKSVGFSNSKKDLGQAISFNGAPLAIPFSSADQLNKPYRFTVAFWLRAEESKGTVFEQHGYRGLNLSYYAGGLRTQTDHVVSGNYKREAFPAKSWIHIAVTYDREKVKSRRLCSNGINLFLAPTIFVRKPGQKQTESAFRNQRDSLFPEEPKGLRLPSLLLAASQGMAGRRLCLSRFKRKSL